MTKRIAGLILFLLIFLFYRFIPSGNVLSIQQITAFSLMAMCIVMWFTEFVPMGGAAIFILVLPTIMGITSMRQMLTPFPNSILFFVIATYSLSAAMTKVPLAKRILLLMLRTMGKSVNLVILSVMTASFFISSVMSNVPATAIFIPIGISCLELYDKDEDKKKTGCCMMVCLAVAGMVGGIITPAGSSNNLIALSFLEQYANTKIPFLSWMIVCAPIGFIVLPFAWFLAVKLFKPVPVSPERMAAFIKELNVLPKPGKKEIIVDIIFVCMIALWILSTWFPFLDITIIAVIGMAVMFLPGIDIFNWREFSDQVGWSTILMIGSVLCLGNVLLTSGVAQFLADIFFKLETSVSIPGLICRVGVFVCFMQILIPNGPALIATVAAPIILSTMEVGVNPAILIFPLSILASWTIIIPFCTVPLITYSTGYYKVSDLGKVGVPVLTFTTLFMAVWLPWITKLVL